VIAESVEIALSNREGQSQGKLTIQLLPSARPIAQGLLLDLRIDPNRDPSLAAIQLLEGAEYRYQFDIVKMGALTTDRPELFEPDDLSGRAGRLRPGLSTGTLPIAIRVGQAHVAEINLEVRSRKLDYLSQYRWMLRDLAESMAEIIMERFAVSQQSFSSLANVDAKTLYQRFAFLQSLLEDEAFVAALHRILYRPYIAWNEIPEQRSPNQSVRAGSAVARSIAQPGPRMTGVGLPSGAQDSPWRSMLPRTISVQRTEETLNNFPNQFVKFALTRWRDQSAAVLDALGQELPSAPVTRGRAEATKVIGLLDEFLTAGVLREVGHLRHFASDNPVLLQREGYRDVYRAFLQFELAAQLSWTGGEDVYGAGQRNVATLYEYWAFLQVALALSSLCGKEFEFAQLFAVQDNELNLQLKRGRSIVLTGAVSRFGRTILLELWFNRTFSAGPDSAPSWSKEMRPDCSLRLRPDRSPGVGVDDVWVHFDAKYRVDVLTEIFGKGEERRESGTEQPQASSYAKRDDLLKMHAYRDAIHRSAGAYVLYPGDSDEQCKKYHELLPGLGAFGLRPSSDGEAIGAKSLTAFLNDVISHVASQVTQHERSRFWERRSFSGNPPAQTIVPAVSFLKEPPADTRVLLGYVKDAEHRTWIERTGLYNLRADSRRGSVNLDSRELAASIVLLYGEDSDLISFYRVIDKPVLKARDAMLAIGYPRPRGTLYFCLAIEPLEAEEASPRFSSASIRNLVEQHQQTPLVGMPIVVSWAELLQLPQTS
jgi:predicted component of viral defense system (DUF524 family)